LAKGNSRTLYEDRLCYVIPDRFPSQYGHLLVISKRHHENLLETPDGTARHMFIMAKKLSSRLKQKLGAKGVHIAVNIGKEAGQLIYHFHIHLIPINARTPKGFAQHEELEENMAQDLIGVLR